MFYEIIKLKEFDDWLSNQNSRSKSQIEKRLAKVLLYKHFGNRKILSKGLEELKFNDGRRIYYSIITSGKNETLMLILGGTKNGQEKDIWKAKSLLKKYRIYRSIT